MIRSPARVIVGHLTARRAVNAAASLLSYALSLVLRRPIVLGQPVIVMVEPTNFCNLRCPLCPAGSNTLTRAKGKMAWDDFTRLVDETAGDIFLLSLWNIGEPLLHDRLMDMIGYAKEKRLYVMTSTNGQMLNRQEVAAQIVCSGLDELIISLDGASPETYDRYRQSGKIDHVLEGIRLVVAEKRRLGSAHPLVDLQFIVMRHNEHEIETMENLAKSLGVDILTLKTVQVHSQDEAEEFLPQREELRRYHYKNGTLRMKGTLRNHCRWLWFSPTVNWDGTVVPCCFDKDNGMVMGQISRQTSLRHIWRGATYQALRRQVLQDRQHIELCTNCSEGLRHMFLRRLRFTHNVIKCIILAGLTFVAAASCPPFDKLRAGSLTGGTCMAQGQDIHSSLPYQGKMTAGSGNMLFPNGTHHNMYR